MNKPDRKLILVSGFKMSGKDTFSKVLRTEFALSGIQSEIVHLASKMKNVVADAVELPVDHFELQELKELPFCLPMILNEDILRSILNDFGVDREDLVQKHKDTKLNTPREILMYVGTEILRDLSMDIHSEKLDEAMSENKVYIVSDLRFLSEYKYFSKYEPISLFVKRDSKVPKFDENMHQSEREMFELMENLEVVPNNSDLGDLSAFAKKIVDEIKVNS